MKSQELYQFFVGGLNSEHTQRQVDDWWSWVVDHHKGQLNSENGITWLEDVMKRLLNDEPVQYIFNTAYFYDLQLYVNTNVLIPRPETEELVHLLLSELRSKKANILDIGTGSGAIPIMIQKKYPDCRIWACDISQEALTVAKRNAGTYKVNVDFFACDLLVKDDFSQLPRLDVLVSNPPYVSRDESIRMTKNTLHEPDLALFAPDNDVMNVYRSLGLRCLELLKDSGLFYFEINEFLAGPVQELLINLGLKNIQVIKDMQGKDRIIKGIKDR